MFDALTSRRPYKDPYSEDEALAIIREGEGAKFVQLVSSGFFGSPQRVADPAHAVSLLGLDTLVAVAELPDVFFPLGQEVSREPFFVTLNTHSRLVAEAAKAVAESETDDGTLIGDAYLSGLLHDIGILVFPKDSPEHYLETVALARMNETTLKQSEKRTFDTTRDDVGAYLMGLWGLPDPVVRAIAYHLSPSQAPDGTFGPLAAVHVANAAIEQDSTDTPGAPTSIDVEYLEQTGCADRLETWREICKAPKSEGVTQ